MSLAYHGQLRSWKVCLRWQESDQGWYWTLRMKGSLLGWPYTVPALPIHWFSYKSPRKWSHRSGTRSARGCPSQICTLLWWSSVTKAIYRVAYSSRGVRLHQGWEMRDTEHQAGRWGRRLSFISRQEAERANWKQGKGFKFSNLYPSDTLSSARPRLLSLPK